MTTTTIRVSTATRDTLSDLAAVEGKSMQWVLDRALELYRRQQLLAATNAAYAMLRESEPVWQEVETERAAWDAALGDGLEPY